MFPLDQPSTIAYQAPSWIKGSFNDYVGKGQQALAAASGAIYSNVRAFIDPVEKTQAQTSQVALNVIKEGVDGAYGALGNATSAIVSGLKKTVEPLTTGIRWGVAIVIIGLVLYGLAIAGPFIPRPGARA